MSAEVKIPPVGESITSGLLSTWHKEDGETVAAGDILLTLETDKVSTELTATSAGQLRIKVQAGEEVKIGDVVGSIEEAGASSKAPAAEAPAGAQASAGTQASLPVGGNASAGLQPAEAKSASTGQVAPLSSPPAQTVAPSHGVEVAPTAQGASQTSSGPTEISTPAGPGASMGAAMAPLETPSSRELAVATSAEVMPPKATGSTEGRITRKRMSPIRRKIAAQLVMAQQTAAILTTFNECDMSAVMSLRKELQEAFTKEHGLKLGFMSFFVKAVVSALQAVPAINSRMDGEDLITNSFFDVGVAIGTERGLVVPVIRNADKKSFAEIEKDIIDYAQKSKEGKIKIEDLTGGVFTISNGGTYGSLLSTPILNPPQSGILGMHKIQERPVAEKGQIVIRPMMYLALSYDHRVVDGKEAVTFLIRIKDCIENPARLLLGL